MKECPSSGSEGYCTGVRCGGKEAVGEGWVGCPLLEQSLGAAGPAISLGEKQRLVDVDEAMDDLSVRYFFLCQVFDESREKMKTPSKQGAAQMDPTTTAAASQPTPAATAGVSRRLFTAQGRPRYCLISILVS
jgi:hypothetical protein